MGTDESIKEVAYEREKKRGSLQWLRRGHFGRRILLLVIGAVLLSGLCGKRCHDRHGQDSTSGGTVFLCAIGAAGRTVQGTRVGMGEAYIVRKGKVIVWQDR